MRSVVSRLGLGAHLVGWAVGYLAVALLPLAFLLLRPVPVRRGFWIEFGVAIGFVGLAMMCLQAVLTARFAAVSKSVGQDNLLQFHRQAGLVAFGLVAAHPVILLLGDGDTLAYLDPWASIERAAALWFVIVILPALLVTSLWRHELRLRYEWWRLGHGVLAVLVVLIGIVHVARVGYYSSDRWTLAFWIVFGAASIGSVVVVRLVRPWRLRSHPYRVSDVREVASRTWNVKVEPEHPPAVTFEAGQFAFVTFADSPFSLEQHPFSIASGVDERGHLEFAVKELGDFTDRIGRVPVGSRVYVDGPYGAMTLDVPDGGGLFAVAGGIGISPVLSMVRSLAASGRRVPVTLVVANVEPGDVAFAGELDDLLRSIGEDSIAVHVLDRPSGSGGGRDGGAGVPVGAHVRPGPVDHELLSSLLPAEDRGRWQYVTCGPPGLMEAVEASLVRSGVPLDRIESERFDIGAAAATGRRHTNVRRIVIGIGTVLVAASALFAATA